jgi:hypothetical protein
MRGRLTYEMVNKFIDAFNMALKKKYQLFSHPRSTLKGKKLAEYDAFKKQETKETIEKGTLLYNILICTSFNNSVSNLIILCSDI